MHVASVMMGEKRLRAGDCLSVKQWGGGYLCTVVCKGERECDRRCRLRVLDTEH